MNKEKICGECRYNKKDGWDWICVNDNSENYADWIGYASSCDDWEEKEWGGDGSFDMKFLNADTGFAEKVFHIHVRNPGEWDETIQRFLFIYRSSERKQATWA